MKGVATSQRDLGVCYFHGHGMKKDQKKGFEFCSQAAKDGDAMATWCVGNMYRFGAGVEQNNKQALRLLHEAANLGMGQAKLDLQDLISKIRVRKKYTPLDSEAQS